MEFETQADSTDRYQPFEIKTEDITEHDDKPRPYLCTVCDKRFPRRDSLHKHSLIHSGVKPLVRRLCGNKNGSLNRREQIHTEENMYSCSECEKSFSLRNALSMHKNIHTDKYKCTECDIRCRCSLDLVRHRRIHSGKKPFECSVCSKRFARAARLAVHSRTYHSGKKPYKCPMCGEEYIRSCDLNGHIRVHHTGDKPYKCSLCSERFGDFSSLMSHQGDVHRVESPSCSESQNTLRCYKNIHSGKYKCVECGECFGSSDSLATHRRNHFEAAVMRYVCGQCSARFMQLGQLKRHLLESHGEGISFGCNVPE